MYTKVKYPNINIRSKNELAKRISSKDFPLDKAKLLLNKVLLNPELYWKDSKRYSEPEKGKYVRNAKGTELGELLKRIDTVILSQHDNLLPDFIYGGRKKSNHILAAKQLLGEKRKRRLLSLDITSFFEQIKEDRVSYFFHKCGCSLIASKLLAKLCCVPCGEKGNGSNIRILARGFATSPRLSAWCNLETFTEVERVAKAFLKNKDPRVAIYIDDIGITASRVEKSSMDELKIKLIDVLSNFDKKQSLPIKEKKTKNVAYNDPKGLEHLGLKLERNKLKVGRKVTSKFSKINQEYKHGDKATKKSLKKKVKAYHRYTKTVLSA